MIKNIECPHCGYDGTIAPDHRGPPFTIKVAFPTYVQLEYVPEGEGFRVKRAFESENAWPECVLCEECEQEFEFDFNNYAIELGPHLTRKVKS